jgi:uncharacterized BrkB/YihY/UPF0761 family membrane protein
MTWFYWTSFVLLVGAELNAELAKESKMGEIQQKETQPLEEPVSAPRTLPFRRVKARKRR